MVSPPSPAPPQPPVARLPSAAAASPSAGSASGLAGRSSGGTSCARRTSVGSPPRSSSAPPRRCRSKGGSPTRRLVSGFRTGRRGSGGNHPSYQRRHEFLLQQRDEGQTVSTFFSRQVEVCIEFLRKHKPGGFSDTADAKLLKL